MPKLNNSFIANITFSYELYSPYKLTIHAKIKNKLSLILQHLNRSLEIQPGAEVHALIAALFSTKYKNYKGAKNHLLTAIRMKPNL